MNPQPPPPPPTTAASSHVISPAAARDDDVVDADLHVKVDINTPFSTSRPPSRTRSLERRHISEKEEASEIQLKEAPPRKKPKTAEEDDDDDDHDAQAHTATRNEDNNKSTTTTTPRSTGIVARFCPHVTKAACRAARGVSAAHACPELHFRPVHQPWSDRNAGECTFLDKCRYRLSTCRYRHYELDQTVEDETSPAPGSTARRTFASLHTHSSRLARPSSPPPFVYSPTAAAAVPAPLRSVPDPQWIQCDLRTFDLSLLGKFGVVMADPPWDINIELPYGTMSDVEMRRLALTSLQTDGYIFLWVTGRAMELGRELLTESGYRRCGELVWVKINQLQSVIRTGRTGHFLNHSKEHCLVGVKGDPSKLKLTASHGERAEAGAGGGGAGGGEKADRNEKEESLDCDVIVSEVREASRKPDEVYGVIERLAPGTRKLELFGRGHNTGQPGWITLGNQLGGSRVVDREMAARIRAAYPGMQL